MIVAVDGERDERTVSNEEKRRAFFFATIVGLNSSWTAKAETKSKTSAVTE